MGSAIKKSSIRKTICLGIELKMTIALFVVGLIMMFLIPTWQTPDEYTHLQYIGDSIKNQEFAGILSGNVGIDGGRMMMHYEEKVNLQELKTAMFTTPGYHKSELFPQGISLSIVKHLPATIGIFVGIMVGLPAFWVLQLGELFSLFFYVLICYFALKIMPLKKEVFAMILLMPIAMQQAGGIGYDSVLIPLCVFWIAYIFHLKWSDNINLKDLICLFLLWAIITYIKMPYCFLILLVFVLPLEKIHLRIGKYNIEGSDIRKYRFWLLGIVLISVVAVTYLLRENYWFQLVFGLMKEWKRTLYLLKTTGQTWAGSLIVSSVGNFGWLDTPILPIIAIMVYIIMMIAAGVNSDSKTTKMLTTRDRIVIWGTWSVLCLFTAFAMVNHTIMVNLYGTEFIDETYNIYTALYQIPYIGGLQGRYFLPYVILLFVPFPQLKQVSEKKAWATFSILEVALFIYIIYVLLARYWFA